MFQVAGGEHHEYAVGVSGLTLIDEKGLTDWDGITEFYPDACVNSKNEAGEWELTDGEHCWFSKAEET